MQLGSFVMKLPALLAVLLAASASVATAEPKQQENSGRVSYNDKEDAAAQTLHRDGDVVELASPTPAKHGKEFIEVGPDAGQFSQLRVDAHDGTVIVRRVRIDYLDGKSQLVNVDKVLNKRNPSATITVAKGPRAIDSVVVMTERETTGSYSLQGIVGSQTGGIASR
ncbi:MAG: hypothetical protein JWO36_6675 [Myxococcales bacterium]|nr:hypothetical protein [Myxococcales bacterium]